MHAVRIVAELGDLSRFDSPRQLMGYLGLIPSEDSSGPRRRQGAITKAGNSSARRALVEAAQAYRIPARVIPGASRAGKPDLDQGALRHRLESAAAAVRALSPARRPRRCNRNKIVVAIARELAGFVWAIARRGQAAAVIG